MSETPSTSDAPATKPALPPPSATTASTPTPARPRVQIPAAGWFAALLVVALALIAGSPYWAPALMPLLPWNVPSPAAPASSPAQDQIGRQLAAIQQQLGDAAALSNRVAALESRPAPDTNAASAAVAPLTAQVQQLSTRLDQIDKQLAQLTHDEATNAESPQRVLMVSLASLGNAVASSRPFAAELASVEALGQSRSGWAAALQPLDPVAKTGIPSTAVLAQRFTSDVAPAILRAEAASPTGKKSLGEAMLARLRGLIVIRRIDSHGVGTNPTDQAVAAAQAALDKDDLTGAVKALDALSGAPAAAAQPWLADAEQRLAAEQTIAKLTQDLAGDLAAGASGG